MTDKIELLGEELIDHHPALAMEVLGASSRLAIPLGWHYLLDLVWVLRELGDRRNLEILEIGGGMGLLQFMLADRGHHVISADMRVRTPLPQLRGLYGFRSLGNSSAIDHKYLRHHALAAAPSQSPAARFKKALKLGGPVTPTPDPNLPQVTLYRCDATNMKEIAGHSVDCVISISALEHNDSTQIRRIVAEAIRVCKPGGVILHTTSACRSGEQVHEQSHSNLFGESELADLYQVLDHAGNFARYDELCGQLKASRYLGRWLAHTYYRSEKNGMPWGIWNPTYMPVGIRKDT
ncbi:class I SAM-dependent methyltransferase [Candidatus Sumerlaeota bacterium]|nr:class I SAM-dependent methyltransferase [Candidatus Sumerlaeota bacterium]